MTVEPQCAFCPDGGSVVKGYCYRCHRWQPGQGPQPRPRRPKFVSAEPHLRRAAPPDDGSLRLSSPPATSQRRGRSATIRQLLLNTLRELGEQGERCPVEGEGGCLGHATDERLAQIIGEPPNTVTPRRGDLEAEGKVLRYGKATTSSGKTAALNHLIEPEPQEVHS